VETAEIPGFSFPVGYERFHRKQLFNFQLNRPYSLGYARAEDLAEAGRRIGSFAQWKTELLRQADAAVAEGRVLNAAFYVRAAEFYTFPDDPDKAPLYDRFLEHFREAVPDSEAQRFSVPYGNASLPALDLAPMGPSRGSIILHGGYDSFIEEFYSFMRYFSQKGYRVIGFDGPGQGGARRLGRLPLDYRWENPVAAVLDQTGLEDVTLLGLSMGGYFALRAASFEGRVGRVIASGHAYDYMRVAPAPAAWLLTFFCNHFRDFTNKMSLRKIRQGGMEAWNISHLMYVLGVDEPMAGLEFAMEMNELNLRSNRVKQDVLLLASRNDHFIPFRLHHEQLRRLSSARSVADRVFSKADHAENHCQIGNLGLALRVMEEWIREKSGASA
jgi:pimeloyl-ACP methyl ester carboxylesterase